MYILLSCFENSFNYNLYPEPGLCLLCKDEAFKQASRFHAAKKNNDEEDEEIDEDDDYYDEEEDRRENPFDKEPTDKDIIEEEFPVDPEEDLFDDDDEAPYN
jgi:hypothetical protein